MIVVESAGITDVGRKRTGNEDSLFYDDAMGLYVVADGMGGHNAGEVASKIVADTCRDQMKRFMGHLDAEKLRAEDGKLSTAARWLNATIHMANRQVFDESQKDPALKGMGSTVSAVYLADDSMIVGNVGDSPIYRVRDGSIELISVLHTMMAEYEAMAPNGSKNLSEQFKHMITRAMGIEKTVRPDVSELPCRQNDVIVISSDGLTDLVKAEEIRDMTGKGSVADICRALVDLANEKGGHDNITVIVMKVVDTAGKDRRPEPAAKQTSTEATSETLRRLPVSIDTDDASFSAYVHHMDTEGAFIETTDPFAVGTEIYMTVSDMDDTEHVLIIARVEKRRSMGINVSFPNLSDKKKGMIQALLARL